MKRRDIEQLFLLGDEAAAARLVPIVRAKADEYAKRVGQHATITHRIDFTGGSWAIIKLRRARRKYFVYADSGGPEYEFFTSEGVLPRLWMSPPYDDPDLGLGAFICGRGSTHKWRGIAPESRALVELCGQCEAPEGGPSWPVYPCHDIAGEELMRTHYAWQNQRGYEYVWWPNNDGTRFVTSAAGSVQGFSNVGRNSRCNFGAGYSSLNLIEDTGWDLRPSLYHKDSSVALAHGAPDTGAPNWWRRACLITAGGRDFFCMTDVNGHFHFWPAGNYGGIIIPSVEVKTVIPSMPDWVDGGLDYWNFNKDGSRAVCCPHERFAPPLTKGGETVYKDAITGYYRVTAASAPGYLDDCWEGSPGLVEVAISIVVDEVTNEWTPMVYVSREEEFTSTGKYYVSADYAFADERLPYPEDSLVMLRFEIFISDASGYFQYGGNYWPDDFDGLVRSRFVIEAWDAAADVPAWFEVASIIGHWDVQLAFLTQYYIDIDGVSGAGAAGWGDSFAAYTISTFDYAAGISAINLRSLSWLQTHQSPKGDLSGFLLGTSVYAYGELVEQEIPAGITVPIWITTDFGLVDNDKRELWSNGYHLLLDTDPLIAFSPHPRGHWAIATNSFPPGDPLGRMVDIVNTRIRGADQRTTHQALYNAAFNDTRDVNYYIQLGEDPPAGDSAPRGTFQTFGIWRDK